MDKPRVVLGILGPVLDRGAGPQRWEQWRPTVAVCQQEDLLIQRFELLHQKQFARLAGQVAGDMRAVSPETEVVLHQVAFADPWDFEEVFATLHDFARDYPFRPEEEEYLVHITTGTHVAQICLFLLTESRELPGKLLHKYSKMKFQFATGNTLISGQQGKFGKTQCNFQLNYNKSLLTGASCQNHDTPDIPFVGLSWWKLVIVISTKSSCLVRLSFQIQIVPYLQTQKDE